MDRAIDHLVKKRDNASGAERENIDRTIEYLRAYKEKGMDVRVKTPKNSGGKKKSVGSPVRPPVKGGVFKPRGLERR